MMTAEYDQVEPVDIQRRILVSFCVTVFIGFGLGVVYMAKRSAPLPSRPTINPGWRTVSVPDPPAPLPESASPYAEIPAANQFPARLKLDMVATEDAWVEVETDGRVTYAKLVRAEQALSFEASERIRIMTGNAPGLELRLNGEPVAATGAKRRVRNLEFTSEGPSELNSIQRVSKS
jgi:hypothetical protein